MTVVGNYLPGEYEEMKGALDLIKPNSKGDGDDFINPIKPNLPKPNLPKPGNRPGQKRPRLPIRLRKALTTWLKA